THLARYEDRQRELICICRRPTAGRRFRFSCSTLTHWPCKNLCERATRDQRACLINSMFRMKLISAGRLAALALFIAITAALVVYLMHRTRRADTSANHPILEGQIVAVFHNTRYAHEVDGHVRFVMTAGVDKTYQNGNHELEQVKLDSFGKDGTRHDVVT